MKNTIRIDEAATKCPANFNLDKYSGRVFDMFSGETVEVTLECKEYIINYLIDRFGKEFIVKERGIRGEDGEARFIASATVDASPTFYAWIFQFGGDIRLLGPERVVDEYDERLKKQLLK